MKAKKLLAILLVAAMSLSSLTACSKDENTDNDKDNSVTEQKESDQQEQKEEKNDESKMDKTQVFDFSDGSPVLGLNPMINTTGPDNGAQQYFYETLIRDVADENGDAVYKMAVAEDYEISDDGTVYTFKIRDNAKWSDGVSVTANDFVYTYRKMADPETASTNAWLFEGIIDKFTEALYEGGSVDEIGVKAVNDTTLEFKLTKPCGYFLDLLTGAMPVREDIYEKYGDAYGSTADKTVFNGPFVIESWDQNVQMTLVKNKEYWDYENVTLQKLNRKVLQDTATAAQALLSGDIDTVSTTDSDWTSLIEADDGFYAIQTPGSSPEFLGFNCSNKYFKNEKIRLAFSLAIDREKYVEDLRDGKADPIYNLVTEGTMCGEQSYKSLVEGDTEIVKTLAEEHTDLKALLIEGLKEEGLDPDPAKMEVSYTTRGTSEFSKKSAEWLTQMWKEKLGVNVLIDMIEWNVMWDRVDQGDYDICTSGWGPYYNDPNGLLSLFHPEDGYFNSKKSGWVGEDAERFGELIDLAGNETDQKKRAQYFYEAEQLLIGKAVIAPTYLQFGNQYLANYVKGYYTNPNTYTDLRYMYTVGKPGAN